jgi:hypothetical protein
MTYQLALTCVAYGTAFLALGAVYLATGSRR